MKVSQTQSLSPENIFHGHCLRIDDTTLNLQFDIVNPILEKSHELITRLIPTGNLLEPIDHNVHFVAYSNVVQDVLTRPYTEFSIVYYKRYR